MSLAELQRAVQAAVLRSDRAAERLVRGTEHFDARSRLHVYEHAFQERLIDALSVTYPALHGVLGEVKFRELTGAFVKHFPSRHFSIRHYGSELDAFIARELTGSKATVLRDLARWEWSLAAAFDAADAETLSAAQLATIDPGAWAQLRFQLAPSLQRLTLTSNAVQWWRFATQQTARPTRWRLLEPRGWAVWRSELSTFFRSLPADEAQAIDAVAAGQSFAAVCDVLSEIHGDDAPARAAALLQQWLRDGWIAGVQHP
ncbi:MAG TPA: DNA-binding domain-containing protein [Steroidobacteraceae bacterium]|nr:DNA-binding domain-containing protein [Steroidobacteraceae bacterium]